MAAFSSTAARFSFRPKWYPVGPRPFWLGRISLAMLLAWTTASIARSDDFSSRDRFFARLATSMTSIQDGKPFREALVSIADQVELNLWLDRKVDPTAPVVAGPVGPTVMGALEKIAAQRDCVVMPVANVVLVGRPQWVDRTAASLLSIENDADPAAFGDVTWEMLTTPQTALQTAADLDVAQVIPPLPHDLWPAIHWKQIDRRVAVSLVLAQFDLRPQSSQTLAKLTTDPATDQGVFSRRYSTGSATKAVREAMQQVDRKSRFRVNDGWLETSGTIAAHRAAVAVMLGEEAVAAKPDPKKTSFTLKQSARTSAENALNQFAQTAQRTCVIDADAIQACQKIITLQAKDYTLYELIDEVADQAGVEATWNDSTVVVTLK